MKTMYRRTNRIVLALKWVVIAALSLIAILFIIRWVGRGINNRIHEGGVNASMYVDVNGSRQWINIYGQDKNNPVLLYLHGGPGSATSLFDYAFTRKWSDVYNIDGDMDYQTNFELLCEYFSKVNAPEKEFLVMKNATHVLLESRSEEFSALLHGSVAP